MNESSDGESIVSIPKQHQQRVIVSVEMVDNDAAAATDESKNENEQITNYDSIVNTINNEISENFRFLEEELIRDDVEFPSSSSSLIDDNNNHQQQQTTRDMNGINTMPDNSPDIVAMDPRNGIVNTAFQPLSLLTRPSTVWTREQQAICSVCIRHAFKHYGSKKKPNHVLSNLNMNVAKGTM